MTTRRPELDGFRGIALLLVLFAHVGLAGFGSGGVSGVTLFFVLSGYLITTILAGEIVATGHLRVLAFYGRRAARLLPALVVLFGVGVIYESARGDGSQTLRFGIVALLYFGNWVSASGTWLGPWFGHTWSLAIEEQFYVIWPAVLILFRRRLGVLMVLAVTGAGLSMLERLLLWHGPGSYNRVYHGTDTRADAILLGSALALWAARGHRLPGRWALVAGAVLLAAATPFTGTTLGVFVLAPTLAALGGALLLAYLAPGERGRFLRFRPLVYTGRISYGMYLWQVPLVWLLMPRIGALGVIVLTYVLATASFYVVERPCQRLARRGRRDAPSVHAVPVATAVKPAVSVAGS